MLLNIDNMAAVGTDPWHVAVYRYELPHRLGMGVYRYVTTIQEISAALLWPTSTSI